jgi:hypothetical protein
MRLTEEQSKAVDLFGSSRSLKISAFAGTGKTSTLKALADSTRKRGLYLAFNSSIAKEAAAKFPRAVDCRTTHSVAFRAVPDEYRGNNAKLTDALHGNYVAQQLRLEEIAVGRVTLKPRALAYLATKTVQRFCQSADTEVLVDHVPLSGKLDRIESRYKRQFKSYISELSAHLWSRAMDPSDPVPLGHDGYLKLWSLSRPTLAYEFILLDEAQDTNEAVLSVLRAQRAHLTLVGDRHQQIYAWRGAINAMASVETEAEAALTRSFRFGESLANVASLILRDLGEERRVVGDPSRDTRVQASGETGTILCRTNAGVVSVVIDELAGGRKPHVVGGVGDLNRLLEDVTKLKKSIPATSPEFFGFENWDEVVEFALSEEGESLRTFVNIVKAHGEVSLIRCLKSVARDEAQADTVISTGHKAKGREWDSVALFSDFEPRDLSGAAELAELREEEARLLYVATTRARKLLVVPPGLANAWNVVPAPPTAPSTSPALHQAPPFLTRKPFPQLPSFAKVVPHQTEPEPAPRPALVPVLAPTATGSGPAARLGSNAKVGRVREP